MNQFAITRHQHDGADQSSFVQRVMSDSLDTRGKRGGRFHLARWK